MTRAQELRDRMLCAEDDEEVTTDEVDAMRRAHREVDALREALDVAEANCAELEQRKTQLQATFDRRGASAVQIARGVLGLPPKRRRT